MAAGIKVARGSQVVDESLGRRIGSDVIGDRLALLPDAAPQILDSRPGIALSRAFWTAGRCSGWGHRDSSCSVSTLSRTHVRDDAMDVLPSRVFMNGNSQAVRIPAEFRLSSDRVQISRTPEGDLLIHPCPTQRGQALLQALSGFDADFVEALEQQQADKLPMQDREAL